MELLNKHQPTYNQKRVFNRAMALVMGELFTFARHTITQILLSLGLIDEDWSAWYRLFSEERFKEEEAATIMLGEIIEQTASDQPFVVGGDGFHVPRTSQTMAGSGWMKGLNTARFKPGIQRGQRFVELSWLPDVENGYTRAFPFRCLPAFTQKSVPAEGIEPQTEVGAILEALKWTRSALDQAGRTEQMMVTLNDGNYDTLEFWHGLPHHTVGIVRSARNRALYYLPKKGSHGNRKYGIKARAPHKWLKRRKAFKKQKIMIRGRLRQMRYQVRGPFIRDGAPDVPLFLLVIGGGKRPPGSRRKNYRPCFFLISAVPDGQGGWQLPLPIEQILTWVWQRWELEVAHRTMKSCLGLGEKQCWNDKATVATVQWSVWLYGLLLLAGHLVWGNDCGPPTPGLWRKPSARWSFNTLWRAIRAECWGHPDFRATWTWSRDNWLTIEPHMEALFNSALGAARA